MLVLAAAANACSLSVPLAYMSKPGTTGCFCDLVARPVVAGVFVEAAKLAALALAAVSRAASFEALVRNPCKSLIRWRCCLTSGGVACGVPELLARDGAGAEPEEPARRSKSGAAACNVYKGVGAGPGSRGGIRAAARAVLILIHLILCSYSPTGGRHIVGR